MNRGDMRYWALLLLAAAPEVAFCAWLWTVVYHAPLWYMVPAAIVAYACLLALPVAYAVQIRRESERRLRP